jgi:cyclophilin family peptidyl-prolyl cis-trans isomerase
MSTRGHDTGDGQWFFDVADEARLDPLYTLFAEVVEGMPAVDQIMEGDRIGTLRPE